MKYYSDITKKFYDTVKECEKAETDYKASKEKEKAAKEKKAAERKKRASEVEDAYFAMIEAQNVYNKLKNEFIKDYGYYHVSYSNCSEKDSYPYTSFLEELLKLF